MARNLLSTKGVGGFWRGVGMQVGFCGPAHALMFASYEKVLQLGNAKQENNANSTRVALVGFAAGAVSTVLHDVVMVPAETVKQRLQLGYYRGPLHCLSRMVASGGGSLYRSFWTTLATNIPYGGLMMASNESIKKMINPSGEFSLSTYLISGGISGAFAGGLTTPADVVKTKLQTQSLGATKISGSTPQQFTVVFNGFFDAFHAIRKQEGWNGFYRGVGPRMLMYGPSCAIAWVAYESAKNVLIVKK